MGNEASSNDSGKEWSSLIFILIQRASALQVQIHAAASSENLPASEVTIFIAHLEAYAKKLFFFYEEFDLFQ